MKRKFLKTSLTLTTALAIGISALISGSLDKAVAQELELLTPGTLLVTVQPYMPYTAVDNGKLVGLDSDILAAVAEKLGLKIEVNVTDFAGMLGSVQSGRADITIGGIAFTTNIIINVTLTVIVTTA